VQIRLTLISLYNIFGVAIVICSSWHCSYWLLGVSYWFNSLVELLLNILGSLDKLESLVLWSLNCARAIESAIKLWWEAWSCRGLRIIYHLCFRPDHQFYCPIYSFSWLRRHSWWNLLVNTHRSNWTIRLSCVSWCLKHGLSLMLILSIIHHDTLTSFVHYCTSLRAGTSLVNANIQLPLLIIGYLTIAYRSEVISFVTVLD